MNHPVKIIVCGGRDYRNREHLFAWLDKFHERYCIVHLIEGGAKGADRLAWEWANSRGIKCSEYKADWETYGKAAGPRRNQAMLNQNPNFVVAFTGGSGTADMINRAKAAGVKVYDGSKDL